MAKAKRDAAPMRRGRDGPAAGTVADILGKWPTLVAVADDLETAVPTVAAWKRRDRIPAHWWGALAAAARARRIRGVKYDDLRALDDARPKAAIGRPAAKAKTARPARAKVAAPPKRRTISATPKPSAQRTRKESAHGKRPSLR